MSCEYCKLLAEGTPHATTNHWSYFTSGNVMTAVWNKHENIHEITRCKRTANEMCSRLEAEARRFFGTFKIETAGNIDEHIYYTATKRG